MYVESYRMPWVDRRWDMKVVSDGRIGLSWTVVAWYMTVPSLWELIPRGDKDSQPLWVQNG